MSIEDRISYTTKDYSTIKEELINVIPELTEDWTDFRESDTGVVIIDLISMLGDMHFYNIDKEVLELFLKSSSEKQNVKSILEKVGYKIPYYRSADVECQFSTMHTEDIIIPKYTKVTTEGDEEKVSYITYEDDILLPAESQVVIECKQGVKESLEFNESNINANNKIFLPDKEVAGESIELFIDNDKWDEVDDVILHPYTGKFFSLHHDKKENVYITLYPGWENLVDNPSDLNININYLITKGEEGKVGSYKITNIDSELFDINNDEVSGSVEVKNFERSSGGEDPQDIEKIKKEGPKLMKTMWTAVTLEDYEVLSRNYTGVATSLAVDWSIAEKYDLNATTTIGEGENATVDIEVVQPGKEGNNYTVEVIDNTGTASVTMSASITDYTLSVNLGTDSSGNLDSTQNTANSIGESISNLTEFNTYIGGDGTGILNTSEVVKFSGGLSPSGPYEIDLYIVPDDGGKITDLLEKSLLDYLGDRKGATIKLNIKNTIYYKVDVELEVFVYSSVNISNYSNIESIVKDEIREFFDYSNRDYSEIIEYLDIVRKIEDSDSRIARVEMVNPTSNITIPFGQFPELDSIKVNVKER